MRVLKLLLGEIGTLVIAVVSIALVYPYEIIEGVRVSLLALGVVYNLSSLIYDHRGTPWIKRWKIIGKWLLAILYQAWNVIKFIFLMIGYIIDLFGNVFLGSFIRYLVTNEIDTLFGQGGVTISAALGDLLKREKLNARGLRWCKWLSKADMKHENHCLAAIELYEYKLSMQSKS